MQDREQVKAVLADQLQVDPAEVDAKLDAPGVQPDFFVPIVTVPRERYEQVKPVIYPVPGLVFRDQSTRATSLPGLGADLLGSTGEITAEQLAELGPTYQQGDVVGRAGLEAAFEEQLGGQASGTVRIVDAEGNEVEVLHSFAGEPPTPLQTTIDPAVQALAEATLADVDANAALVAVRPTGEVLAVANKPVGGFNRAIAGIYPPGSTFKVATATALLRNGVTPETVVQCPPTIEVGGRSFRNFEGGASGAESFADAFAESCNTAFIGTAEGLPDGALAEAAETFGFNTDYDLGVTTGDTAFPAPEGDTERAAAAIGQARVTASPLHLATMAGAVRAGSWSPPVLLPEAAPQDESLDPPDRAGAGTDAAWSHGRSCATRERHCSAACGGGQDRYGRIRIRRPAAHPCAVRRLPRRRRRGGRGGRRRGGRPRSRSDCGRVLRRPLTPVDSSDIAAVEHWFLARGTPHLIEGYNASEDVLTRALPVLSLVFVLEITGALNADWNWWQNVLAAVGGAAVLIGIWAGVNALRDRPLLSRPARVGFAEVAAFVLGPPLVPLIFGGQPGQALAVAALNVGILLLVYLVLSYGLVPLTRWAVVRATRELETVGALAGRALPLLLLITIVLFINTEMWQVADGLDGPFLAAVIGLFFIVGLAFLLTRLPREFDRLATFADADELRRCVAGTPAERLLGEALVPAAPRPLTRRQRWNLLLVALFSQGVQVLAVTVVLGGFFVALGLLTITSEIIETWLGHPGDALVRFELFGRQVQLTAELLKLSAFLAAFSGLYFTVVLVTDSTYRTEFFDEILAELRQTFAVRATYLAALR